MSCNTLYNIIISYHIISQSIIQCTVHSIHQSADARTVRTRGPHNSLDLLHVLQLRGQPPVHAEYLLIDYCCHWQAVEAVCEGLPQLNIVSSLTYIFVMRGYVVFEDVCYLICKECYIGDDRRLILHHYLPILAYIR